MARSIIAAVRTCPQLKGSLLLAAQELAHRANSYTGIAEVSYQFLAWKCHQSRRTAIRHIARLVELGIIRVQRRWRPGNCWLVNTYQFLLHWEQPAPRPERLCSGDRVAPMLPTSSEKEKTSSLVKEKRRKNAVLGWLEPGSWLHKMIEGTG